MSWLANIYNMLLDKRYVKTIFSTTVALAISMLTVDEFWLKVNLYKAGFVFTLTFSGCLSFIEILLIIRNAIKNKKKCLEAKKEEIKNIEKTYKDDIEMLWTYVDNVSKKDYQRLLKFLETENAPISFNGELSGECLLNSAFVNSTVTKESEAHEISIVSKDNSKARIRFPVMEYTPEEKQYVLKQGFYDILKYSNEKHGKISHFER